VQRRINQIIHTQQAREQVYHRSQLHQEKINKSFDKRSNPEDFQLGDVVGYVLYSFHVCVWVLHIPQLHLTIPLFLVCGCGFCYF
jgi:hypothetical protein